MDSYHSIIDQLVALNMEHRKRHFAQREHISPEAWAREFATVRCDIGRRSGKSGYIKLRAKELDLIVAPNMIIAQHVFARAPCDVITPTNVMKLAPGRARQYKTIFIDEPALVFHAVPAEELYFKLSNDDGQTFILLGV